MKKNNSKKLILAAMLFFSGGFMLSLGNFQKANAAQLEVDNQENGNLTNENEFEQEKEEIEEKETEEKEEEKEAEEKEEEKKTEEKEEGKETEGKEEEKETEGKEEEKETEENCNTQDETGETEGFSGDEKQNEVTGEEREEIEIEESTGVKVKEDDVQGEGMREREEEKAFIKEEKVNAEHQSEEEKEEKNEVNEEKSETENEEENVEKNQEELVEEKQEKDTNLLEGISETVVVQQIILTPQESGEVSEDVTEQIEVEVQEILKNETIDLEINVPEELKQEEVVSPKTEELNDFIETEGIENPEVGQWVDDLSIKPLENPPIPVASVERLESLEDEKELRFYYQMKNEDLVEHQIKVFLNSDGKEELIWQENDLVEGEMTFEQEGNYLIYLYTKDDSGNESRLYQSYTVGNFEVGLKELDQLKDQKINVEEMEERIEGAFEGSNVATYQLFINGEQYKGEPEKIPEGKCILTVEAEDTYGNSVKKTIEVVATNQKSETVTMDHEQEEENNKEQGEKEQIQDKGMVVVNESSEMVKDESTENEKKDSSIPIQVAGILGSLLSGVLIFFRRIKH